MNYFSNKELSCSCCGEDRFNGETLEKLNTIRKEAGFPINLTSAYRCEAHNQSKGYTQTHATGQAVDISCTHKSAVVLLKLAIKHGMTGIGVKQKGSNRFLHFDDLDQAPGRPRPHIWSY